MKRRRARKRRGYPTRRRSNQRRLAFLGVGLASAAAGLAWLLFGLAEPALPEIPTDPQEVELFRLGETLYALHCASCHGPNLEGEPDWRRRRPDGGYPAPPHDGSGHTWHHPDAQLLDIVRDGGQARAMPGFRSRMPAFRNVLSDEEIVAILWFIERHWSAEQRAHQESVTRAREP